MRYIFRLDQRLERDIVERSRLAIGASRALLAVPVWPAEYVPPMFSALELVPRFVPNEEHERAFTRIVGTIFDPLK